VMDINMPVMDGLECLSELKKGSRTKDIPVVIISTSGYEMDIALRLGARIVVKKTNDEEGLLYRLKALVNTNFDVPQFS